MNKFTLAKEDNGWISIILSMNSNTSNMLKIHEFLILKNSFIGHIWRMLGNKSFWKSANKERESSPSYINCTSGNQIVTVGKGKFPFTELFQLIKNAEQLECHHFAIPNKSMNPGNEQSLLKMTKIEMTRHHEPN